MNDAYSLQIDTSFDRTRSIGMSSKVTSEDVRCARKFEDSNRLYWLDGIASSIVDIWGLDRLNREQAVSYAVQDIKLSVRSLGWTITQAIETRVRLLAFEDDWDAPGMEVYDEM